MKVNLSVDPRLTDALLLCKVDVDPRVWIFGVVNVFLELIFLSMKVLVTRVWTPWGGTLNAVAWLSVAHCDWVLHPGVSKDAFKVYSLLWFHTQHGSDEVSEWVWKSRSEIEFATANVLIFFKRNVPACHIIEQNTEWPDRGLFSLISVVSNPFWRTVYSCSCKEQTTIKNMFSA